MAEKKLFLLDGHALVYRAHFAFITRPMINSKGINTSAIMGFTRTLWDLMKNQNPTHIAVGFDISGKTFRNDLYPEYKANRDAQPEDITIAIPYIKQIIKAFNIPIVTLENYEADDLIGTLAKQAEREGFDVYMVTPDKDYAQLVSDKVFMYKPGRRGGEVEILGRTEVLEKWGIERVEQVIDVLGLQGDAVDNIPGIPGIGPKTAVKLLALYDSVEGLIENVDKLKGKQKERVAEFADQARLSKTLATIEINAPVQFNADEYIIDPINRDEVAEIFKELEFRTLAKQILGPEVEKKTSSSPRAVGGQQSLFGSSGAAPSASELPSHAVAEKRLADVKHDYHFCDDDQSIALLINQLEKADAFCFDTETTGLDPLNAGLVGMSFAFKTGEAFYVPISADTRESQSRILLFKKAFESDCDKIAQNIKYDAEVLAQYGIAVNGTYYDTMIMHYLLEPELRHGMDYMSETYLKYKPISITELIGKKGKSQKSMRDIPPETVSPYACEDADITLQLYELFKPRLEEEKLIDLYLKIEEPLIKVIIEIELAGINLDVDFLNIYSKELEKEILSSRESIYKTAGLEFNISSPKQVGDVLFNHLKIPYRWRMTKSGQHSTSEEKLAELAPKNPVINEILRYRMLTKLKSTYVDALPKLINPKTDRIHSSFNQALASTGRLSSNNPNLQNIPIRTPEGREVRKAFVPADDDHVLLAADYSQVELRLIAEISKDEAMMNAFIHNKDIHRATAAGVYDVPYDEVTADQRRSAKTVNFSIIYGAGATNLSQQLDISRQEASELIKEYFKEFNGLKKYMDDTVEFAREHGYVETLLGRKRPLRDINSRNGMIRSGAERVAINTPIQGTAADLIKVAMIDIQKYLQERNFRSKMILQVHDELVFDVYKPELDTIKPVIIEKMEKAIPNLKVPILVEAEIGQTWLEAH